MKTIINEFDIGETVYLVTDTEQLPRLVYCIEVYRKEVMYKVVCGLNSDVHYDFELSKEKNMLFKLTS
jgi:hypothetical protein